jgi:ATP-dependent Clp protease ATP-binding subunit ClpC
MFEKFTEGAIKVIMLSQEEARRMGHNFVGTEQLLLVLLVKDMVLEREH